MAVKQQERKRRPTYTDTPAPEVRAKKAAIRTPEQRAAAAKELDDVLDGIDEVLESNAEQFVAEYVQKGGQ